MIFTYTGAWRCPFPQSPKWRGRCQAEDSPTKCLDILFKRSTDAISRVKTSLRPTLLSKQVYSRFQMLLWASGLYRDSQVPNLLQQQNHRSNWLSTGKWPNRGSAGTWAPWWALLGVNWNPVLVSSLTINSPDWVKGKMVGRGQWKTDISTQFGQASSPGREDNLLALASSPSGGQASSPCHMGFCVRWELRLVSQVVGSPISCPAGNPPVRPEGLICDGGALAL